MKKKNLWNKMSGWLRGFLILALAFLALGLGTLGSVSGTGKGYVLPAKQESDAEQPRILLRVSAPEGVDKSNLAVTSVYFNLGAIYAESGEIANIRLARGGSASSGFYNYIDIPFENFYAKTVDEKNVPNSDALYNWVCYPVRTEGGWGFNNYPFYRLTAPDHSVLINEIVFVAQDSETGKEYALPAQVYYDGGDISHSTLLPFNEERGETAKSAADEANAIVDAPQIPSMAQSSFFRYSQEEIYTLMTVNEMRQGDKLSSGIYRYEHEGKTYYLADTVYNSLGNDLAALGVLMFGMSPFGLRFLPMLASFGVLVFGFLFVRKLTGKDKAGFVFALLYALCGAGFSLGHFGTPLMIGLFFFVAALYFTARFYKDGMKKANFLSALPALLGGLFTACAICVNGAFTVPALLIVGLFIAGAVRQRRKTRAALDAAIDEVNEDEKLPHPERAEGEVSEPRKRFKKAYNAHRIGTLLPCALFFALLTIGTLLISLLAYLPMHQTYVRLYDDPLSRSHSLFYFLWRAYAGGFIGENFLAGSRSVWSYFYVLFRGTGETYAVTAVGPLVAAAALLSGVAGAVLVFLRLVRSVNGEAFKEEFFLTLLPLAGLVISLCTAFFAGGGLGFLLLGYLFLFVFAAAALAQPQEGKLGVAVKILSWVCLAALVAMFAVFAAVTFSIPTSGFLWGLAG